MAWHRESRRHAIAARKGKIHYVAGTRKVRYRVVGDTTGIFANRDVVTISYHKTKKAAIKSMQNSMHKYHSVRIVPLYWKDL